MKIKTKKILEFAPRKLVQLLKNRIYNKFFINQIEKRLTIKF